MQSIQLKKSFGTHDGSFHADELTACGLLLLFDLIDKDKIFRSRNQTVLDQCEFVCDVGGVYDPDTRRFDHHQKEYNGSMSSAGMVLLYLKEEGIIDEETWDYFNKSLVIGIDAHDNGLVTPKVGHCSFSEVVHNFVPVDYASSESAKDAAFFVALDFVRGHLRRLLERFEYIRRSKTFVAEAMEERGVCLYFETAMPWMDAFFELGGERHPAQFLIMPAGTHWKLRGIPPTYEDRMSVRRPMPEEWAGLFDEELKQQTGIEGAVFCHKGRFISVWETKEAAQKALDSILGAGQ